MALALLFAACDAPAASWPELSSLYRVEGEAVVCDGSAVRVDAPSGLACTCSWRNVALDGEQVCTAMVLFRRDDEAAAWHTVVFAGEPPPCP